MEEQAPLICEPEGERDRGERDFPVLQIEPGGEFLTGAALHSIKPNTAASLQQEWEDQFVSFLKTVKSPGSGTRDAWPLLSDAERYRHSLKELVDDEQRPKWGDGPQDLLGLSPAAHGSLVPFVKVKEEILDKGGGINGAETRERPDRKVLRIVSVPQSEQELSDVVKTPFSRKAKQEENDGYNTRVLKYTEENGRERAKQAGVGDQLLEGSEGKCFRSPEAELETESHLNGLVENKPNRALFWEETAGSLELREGFSRRESTQAEQGCGNILPQSTDFVRNPQTEEKTYICSYCGRMFGGTSALMAHERTHIAEKIYKCAQCGKIYSRHSDLIVHQKSHTGENPHRCASDCGKCSSQEDPLPTRLGARLAGKDRKCPECGKKFRRKWHLLQHQKSHTKEAQYACSKCGKRYKQAASLMRHMKSHAESKPPVSGVLSLGPTFVLVLSPLVTQT